MVRYGELALKSAPVRREFERALRKNIVDHFAVAGTSCRLRSDRGHLYVEADEASAAIRILRRVFGVTSVSEVVEIATERAAIRAAVLALVGGHMKTGVRFAVRARRTGQHDFTSQELAAALGGDILEAFGDRSPKVDLETPELEVFVEVRDTRTYLYTGREPGPGGLPLGVAGRVAALVDGPRGALGAYLLMKRGCHCALLPTGSGRALVDQVLLRFDPHARVGEPVSDLAEAEARLERLADETRADGVVLALAVDDYPAAKARWGERVVFSPTVGFGDEEVDARWLAAARLAG